MNELDSLRLALDGERHNHRKDNEYLLARIAELEQALQKLADWTRDYAIAHDFKQYPQALIDAEELLTT